MTLPSATHPSLVAALGNAVAAYHRGTFEHSGRVAANAVLVGEVMGLGAASLEALGWAGELHDLGKLAVPEAVLGKVGGLTAEEWEQVKAHPIVGQSMLLSMSDSWDTVAAAVGAHHERWDGSGYPDGLRGEDIPLLGRIITVVDVYDALTHQRSYRRGQYSHVEARAMIVAGSGTHFDPAIVAVYLDVLAGTDSRLAS